MKKYSIVADILVAAISILFLSGCRGDKEQNVLSEQEKKDGWTLLFDGKTMNGWHLFNRGKIPSTWSADSGQLVCNPHAKEVKHGDLVTDKIFQDFDLQFDWKISKAGNSGLFINVWEPLSPLARNTSYWTTKMYHRSISATCLTRQLPSLAWSRIPAIAFQSRAIGTIRASFNKMEQ
jgi:hypothetical protein